MLLIKFHFKQDSMANILSFKKVSSVPGAKITMDTDKEYAITVKLKAGEEYMFKQYSKDL